jgi:hypothetical protein
VRKRNLVIAIGLVVAVAATTIVILYLQGSKGGVIDYADLATVFISKRDIHMNQSLDPLIEDGVILETTVPRTALVVGALTDIRQSRGSTAVSLIRKHEQISANNVVQLDKPA